MFSDGIRPGGDLTELDGSSEVSRMPPRRSRVQKRVERVAQGMIFTQTLVFLFLAANLYKKSFKKVFYTFSSVYA